MAWRGGKEIMEFIQIWNLLNPQGEYKRREGVCRRLWHGYDDGLQQRIFDAISKAKAHGDFINQNPYFAIEDAAIGLIEQAPRQQTLSYADYYARYGTTEPQDGWHMENPTGQKVIYVKN